MKFGGKAVGCCSTAFSFPSVRVFLAGCSPAEPRLLLYCRGMFASVFCQSNTCPSEDALYYNALSIHLNPLAALPGFIDFVAKGNSIEFILHGAVKALTDAVCLRVLGFDLCVINVFNGHIQLVLVVLPDQ